MDVIDSSGWNIDFEHGIFPVGARDKLMLWSPAICSPQIKSSWSYLFKESIRAYPDQFWCEIIAYIVSRPLGVDVPKAFPAIRVENGITTCGSLLEWFYDVRSQRFVHGSQYFQRINDNFDNRIGRQHNLHDLLLICKYLTQTANLVTPYITWMADIALFDALIGNTDRHQENWGIIFNDNNTCELSPLFDNGTSLGHERFPSRVQGWDEAALQKYMHKGFHHLRYVRSDPTNRIQLFDFVQILASNHHSLKAYMRIKLLQIDMETLIQQIGSLVEINIPHRFTVNRYNWVTRVLNYRYNFLLEILK